MKNEPNTAPTMAYVAAAADIGKDLKKVSGVAYSGGPFSQWWSDAPCVTDLAGMEVAAQIPLMWNHANEPDHRLGAVTVAIEAGRLLITGGGIDDSTERGRAIVDAGQKCEWQLSHGAEVLAREYLEPGTKKEINGQEFTGPLTIISRSLLREVSVVAIGADSETRLSIAAGLNIHSNQSKGGHMEEVKEIKAAAKPAGAEDAKSIAAKAVAEERQRVAGVRAALKGVPEMADKAIAAGWTVEHAQDVADGIKAATAGLQQSTNIIVASKPATTADTLTAALEFRAGIGESQILAAHGEQVTEQASRMAGLSLRDVVVEASRMAGLTTGVTMDHDAIQAAFQSTDLPGILGNVANKALLKEFKAVPVAATKLCSVGDLADYKESLRVRLADVGDLEAVPAGGEVVESQLAEVNAKNQAERYAKVFYLDEMLIVNDDLGAFLRIPRLFGQRAARKIDQVFFKRLLSNPTQSDSSALFSAAHGNYTSGTSSALSLASLKALRALFLKQTDSNGDPLAILPKYLLVPTDLEAAATEFIASPMVVTGNTTASGNVNIVNKWGLEVVASAYLQASKYTGYSTTGWYLFGNPAECDTFEIGYLKGQRTPTVEKGQFDLTRFGVGYRVRFDFGIRELDYRGMAFAKGTN